jgi:hypothetical protein
MKSTVLNLILFLIKKLDDAGVFDVAKALVARKTDEMLQKSIDWLVAEAENTGFKSGAEKKQWVLDRLYDPNAWWSDAVNQATTRAINWGVETAVVAMKEA